MLGMTKNRSSVRQAHWNSAPMFLTWSWVGKSWSPNPCSTVQFSFRKNRTPLEKLRKTRQKFSLASRPGDRCWFLWMRYTSGISWFLLAGKNFSTGSDLFWALVDCSTAKCFRAEDRSANCGKSLLRQFRYNGRTSLELLSFNRNYFTI